MEQRHRLCTERDFQPKTIEFEQGGFGFRNSKDLCHGPAAGHQLEIHADTSVVINAVTDIRDKAVGLFCTADDDFFVGTALNKTLGFVFGIIHVPVCFFPVFRQNNSHGRRQKFDSLGTDGRQHSVRTDGVVPSDHMDGMLQVFGFRTQRDKWMWYFHGNLLLCLH